MNGDKNWYVYIVECSDGTLYTGITPDVVARIRQHNTGKGAKYTQGRGPVQLVFSESTSNRSCASIREAKIKKLSRVQKRLLIEGDQG